MTSAAPAGSGGQTPAGWWRPGDSVSVALAAAAVLLAGSVTAATGASVASFATAALGIAALATLVGRSVPQVGANLSPRATGVLQATVGNLPELLFGIFALRSGLPGLVQAAMVGSVVANVLLVMGIAFVAGGLRFGTQRFDAAAARAVVVLLLVAAAVVAVPSVTSLAHTSAARHERVLSLVAAAALLVVYVGSLVVADPAASRPAAGSADGPVGGRRQVPAAAAGWPPAVAVGILLAASAAAAVVSDWFVASVRPALQGLGLTATFTGVVVVAIAGNAVEHVGGVVLATRDRMDHAVAVVLQSPTQVLLGVFPLLVLLSPAIGGPALTLALPVLLLVAVVLGAVVAVAVVVDGESTWVEGLCLMACYAVVAAATWWGR